MSSSEDEDLHNPQCPYNFNRAFGEYEPTTEIAQAEHDNAAEAIQNKEEINNG